MRMRSALGIVLVLSAIGGNLGSPRLKSVGKVAYHVEWTADGAGAEYLLEVRSESGETVLHRPTKSLSMRFLLPKGVAYTVRVGAQKSEGPVSWSPWSSLPVPPERQVERATEIELTSGTKLQADSISVRKGRFLVRGGFGEIWLKAEDVAAVRIRGAGGWKAITSVDLRSAGEAERLAPNALVLSSGLRLMGQLETKDGAQFIRSEGFGRFPVPEDAVPSVSPPPREHYSVDGSGKRYELVLNTGHTVAGTLVFANESVLLLASDHGLVRLSRDEIRSMRIVR